MRKNKTYIPYATVTLLVLTGIMFLYTMYDKGRLEYFCQVSPWGVLLRHRYYQVVTAIFLHGSVEHLANNMLLLFGLGFLMEETLGHFLLPALYFVTGIAGNLVSIWYKVQQKNWFTPSIGASGAVFGLEGVLLAYALLAPGKMRTASWDRILIVLLFSVYAGIRSTTKVDNAAHIGGLVTGFFLGAIVCLIQKKRDEKKRQDMAGRYGSRVV